MWGFLAVTRKSEIMERLQKALQRLEERGINAKIENNTIYVIIEDNELELSEFEITFQAGEIEERESNHVLGWDTIDGFKLNEKIFDDELFGYKIVCRQDLMDDIMRWISEGAKDKTLMQKDLQMLMTLDDEYIFSSISTNDYIHKNHEDFASTCEDLLALNEQVNHETN